MRVKTSNSLWTSIVAFGVMLGQPVLAADAPPWMRALVGAPLPAHDEHTNAVLLHSDVTLTVQADGSIKQLQRVAYKILRPAGAEVGTIRAHFDTQTRITLMRGWCIPTTGKDYEVREKDAVETAVYGVTNGELISDLRTKLLRIPAANPGNIVGYELEQELRPYMNVLEWDFQEIVPVREARYTLSLPPGWTYHATWLNHAEQSPAALGPGKWQWTLNDLKAVRIERAMPPWRGIAGRMVVALKPPSDRIAGMQTWGDIGNWYSGLTKDRRNSSDAIKQHVAELTASASTPLLKMQSLANFAQNNIRYVAIELGIGGYQPHHATAVFTNRFGDCKDKVTLMHVMLKELGIESYYVIINTERGAVQANTPPNLQFNHVVLAVALPAGVEDPSLLATVKHPKLGRLVYFDPTDTLTPFGRLAGGLQSNYALLVGPDGGELVSLPRLPTSSNSIERTAQMQLDEKGTLTGDLKEIWTGDLAAVQRHATRTATLETDRIKPVEAVAAASFTSFDIVKAAIGNLRAAEKPFEWHYSIEAPGYAKVAGDLLLVRPRVIGSKSTGFLETKEPREHAIEFDRPQRDRDVFEIALPPGFAVDEVPPAVNLDEGFIAYQSKTEVVAGKLRFTRTFEVRELSVPANAADKLKRFYRAIENDERMVAVLKRTTS